MQKHRNKLLLVIKCSHEIVSKIFVYCFLPIIFIRSFLSSWATISRFIRIYSTPPSSLIIKFIL